MKSETLRLVPMGLEKFRDAFNKMQLEPNDGPGIPSVQDANGPLLSGLFGQATVTELFEGARAMTYQIREKHNRQLIATVDVKRIHLERVPPDPERLNGLTVQISWTEPAVSVARKVLDWLAMNYDVKLPASLELKSMEEPKGQLPLAIGT